MKKYCCYSKKSGDCYCKVYKPFGGGIAGGSWHFLADFADFSLYWNFCQFPSKIWIFLSSHKQEVHLSVSLEVFGLKTTQDPDRNKNKTSV